MSSTKNRKTLVFLVVLTMLFGSSYKLNKMIFETLGKLIIAFI